MANYRRGVTLTMDYEYQGQQVTNMQLGGRDP